MSEYSTDYLRHNVLMGYCGQRGNAWHAGMSVDGLLPFHHWDQAVPFVEVRKLFGFTAETAQVARVVNGAVVLNEDGTPKIHENKVEVFHSQTGQSFGYFSNDYLVHQYQDVLLGTVSAILSDTLQIGSAGLLKYGAQAWVQVELPETIELPKIGEAFRPSLLAVTSHDGSLANRFKRVITRIQCDNTLKAGLSESGAEIRFKHSKGSDIKVDAAKEALGIMELMVGDYEKEAYGLVETEVSDKAWDKFLDIHVPLEGPGGKELSKIATTYATNERDELNTLWHSDDRVSPWKNTGWGVLQAVSTYSQHIGIVRKVSRQERNFENMVKGAHEGNDRETVVELKKALAMV